MKKNVKQNNKKKENISIKKIREENKKKTKAAIEEYKKFAVKGNAIDLAVGVVLGSAFTAIVNAIVSTTITPLINLLTCNVDLSTLFITLKGGHFNTLEEAKTAGAIVLNYGELITAIINFLIISMVLFIIISVLKKVTNKKGAKQLEEKKSKTKKCPYCYMDIPLEAKKCAYCTSDILDSSEKKPTNKKVGK